MKLTKDIAATFLDTPPTALPYAYFADDDAPDAWAVLKDVAHGVDDCATAARHGEVITMGVRGASPRVYRV